MFQKRFRAMSGLALLTAFSLFSCDSGTTTPKEAKMDSAAKPADSTPVTKPFDVLVIVHKVADFAKWKPGYEAHDSARKAAGLYNFVIGRGAEDSNTVIVFLRMTDVAKAKEMVASPDMKATMQKAGVVGAPKISFINVLSIDTSAIPYADRVMVSHKVKDFDAWKKEYDDHKSARTAAGIIDRALGYSKDDKNEVTAVMAISDPKKGDDFFKSPDLKAAMDKGGVISKPDVFLYKIVKKY